MENPFHGQRRGFSETKITKNKSFVRLVTFISRMDVLFRSSYIRNEVRGYGVVKKTSRDNSSHSTRSYFTKPLTITRFLHNDEFSLPSQQS